MFHVKLVIQLPYFFVPHFFFGKYSANARAIEPRDYRVVFLIQADAAAQVKALVKDCSGSQAAVKSI